MIIRFFKIIIIIFFSSSYLIASTNYFNEGLILYEKKQLDKAKFKFEQDIVHNPKNERSYLFLSKIFNELEKTKLEEQNLNTVILLNPKNEEAIYLLSLLNIDVSNFSKAKELIDTMKLVCVKLCNSTKELEDKLNSSLKQ